MDVWILIDLQRMNDVNETTFAKNETWEHGGRLKFKINIL
jgi:hypothetical protein